jgi:hypothetical protein
MLLKADVVARASCEQAKLAGKRAPDTNCAVDPGVRDAQAAASAALAEKIDAACGGKDKTCGGDTTGEPSPATLQFAAGCASGLRGSCTSTIQDCGDIGRCLACADQAATDVLESDVFAQLVHSDPKIKSQKPLNTCQRALRKQTQKFLEVDAQAVTKCWDVRLDGKHAQPCPVPGDGKVGKVIAKAAAKRDAAICAACGGSDKRCGGNDDFTPAEIGFPAQCPDVAVPGGLRCGRTIVTLTDVTGCLDCLTRYVVGCADRQRVPEYGPYPDECRP